MALTTFTLAFNSNAFAPSPSPGDVIHAIYAVTVSTAGGNAYPAGGEVVDFSGEFAEVHSALPSLVLSDPGVGQADVIGAMVAAVQLINPAAGVLRFYQGGGAGANLAELTVGAYPNFLRLTITCHGRPITDAQ